MSTQRMKVVILFLGIILHVRTSFSQVDSTSASDSVTTQQIAVFIPLYLDSAFDSKENYRYAKQMPKYMQPGLEFWEGVQLAIDSLNSEGVKLEVHVYDTRSGKKQVRCNSCRNPELQDMNLFIGHVTVNEAASLAQTSRRNAGAIYQCQSSQ